MKKEEKEFNLVNLPSECNDPTISKDDFKLVQSDEKIHDQKFETKPTTFLKDCIKRFRKNKSSVVATFILGILIVLSIFVPILFKNSEVHETNVSHPDIYYLEPKLFPAGTGFWDGTKKMTDIVVDTSDPDSSKWVPARYAMNAVSDLKVGKEQYTTTPNEYAHGGYVQFGYYNNIPDPEEVEYVTYATDTKDEYFKVSEYEFKDSLKVTNFVTLDKEALKATSEETKDFPKGYNEAKSALFFTFNGITGVNVDKEDEAVLTEDFEIQLTDYKLAHNIGVSEPAVEILDKFQALVNEYNAEKSEDIDKLNGKITKPRFEIRVLNDGKKHNACTLIKSFGVDSGASDKIATEFEKYSFEDGNQVYIRLGIYNSITDVSEEKQKTKKEANSGIWKKFSSNEYSKEISYLVRAVLCSFTYDTYEAALGTVEVDVWKTDLEDLANKKIIKYVIIPVQNEDGDYVVDEFSFKCEILNPDKCPFFEEFTAKDVILDQTDGTISRVRTHVYGYKLYYGLDKMPLFLLGTDKSGRDMFIYVFEGLRTSLLLGLATSAICFLFGLFWGAVSGYFGGAVDLAMERLTDILSGVPWIVVMTLTIIHLGSSFFTFALALCLTGWIGTAATTRTQFYRFRGREYVLASRTLGASHARLITKHILPNAMGTIITSAVLMVPSIIFSEATISYLGLGFKNLASLGVILSDNQVELTTHPYLLIFPAVIIALLMISFNLFGNGLRDAVNPSLKGEGE